MRSAVRAVRWLPALVAAAYLINVALELRALVRTVYWNTDMAAPLVLAERLRGHGHVTIPHLGTWTSLWWLLVTRTIPGHRQIWELTGYAFALLGAALVGWATSRVAGRWAGVTAASITIVAGPAALLALLTVNLHTVPPFVAAVLAAYLLVLRDVRSRLVAVAVGVFAGLSAASDPLTLVAAVAPFVAASLVLARVTRTRAIATRAAIVLGCCVPVGIATEGIMRLLGFWVTRPPTGLVGLHEAAHNVVRLGRFVLLAGGVNYPLPGGRYPAQPLRVVVTVVVLCAVGSIVWVAARELMRRADPARVAFACYWAAAVVLIGLAFVLSRQGSIVERPGVFYVLTFAPAAAVGTVLLAARSLPAQLVVAVAVAVVGAVNIAGVRDGRVEAEPGAIGRYATPLIRILDTYGVTKGYAGYWDAQSLSWKSKSKLLVAPVQLCGDHAAGLCPQREWVIESWYDPSPGPSFVLVDPETGYVPRAPRIAKEASGTFRLGPLTLYLFEDDVARRLEQP